MMVGHYATALVAKNSVRDGSLWLFLVASQIADFVMVSLTFAGVEAMEPQRFVDVSLSGLSTEMTFSHDLIPTLAWASGMAAVGWLVTRRRDVALACGALVLFHEAIDLIAGFPHHVMGESTLRVGMNLYGNQPVVALFLEALLGAICVWIFVRGRRSHGMPLKKWRACGLYAVFVFFPLTFLPIASSPLSRFFE